MLDSLGEGTGTKMLSLDCAKAVVAVKMRKMLNKAEMGFIVWMVV